MATNISSKRSRRGAFALWVSLGALITLVGSSTAFTHDRGVYFDPDNLVLSRSVYDNNPNNIKVGTILPPNCAATTGGCAGAATYDGSYPLVWNNDAVDGSFGITSKIFLDQITPSGQLVSSLEVPNSSQRRVSPTSDQLVTSFSSKSELALNLSTDHDHLTFMGYVTPIHAIDVSNSNTPGAVDPTNPVGENVFRAVAQVDEYGEFHFTETNAYSGNNGRAAILSNLDGADAFFTAGNAGNGNNPQPDGIIIGAGAQIMTPEFTLEVAQDPGDPTPVGSLSVTQLGFKADKIGKDDNFRGLTIFNNVLYFSKGSGGNGVNTVYFVDTTGLACPTPMGGSGGVGLPQSGAALPTSALSYNPADLQTVGLPSNMCILAGFPATPNSKIKAPATTAFPFGLWFANATTLYVADEGDGVLADAATDTTAGLQKKDFRFGHENLEARLRLAGGAGTGRARQCNCWLSDRKQSGNGTSVGS